MSKIVAIKENHLFSKVYAKGKKASGKCVAVYVLNNYRSTETRLGITTGKKLGNAVQRSRARRLIREAFRCIQDKYMFCRPFLIVVVARNAIVEDKRKMNDVFCDMEKAFMKLQVFSEDKLN